MGLLTFGIISILLSGVFIGAWTEPVRLRSKQAESEEHKRFRTRLAIVFAVIGIFLLLLGGLTLK
ncbi:hypothetical protein [Bacillus sp. CRN 9]|uniref:hypothetical protein n=1 Tax=Cytobacillus horneckiae TaxID=549687 RepID=UPI001561E10D|nr:hypothetical protein [Bacillus sp. CRN 9]